MSEVYAVKPKKLISIVEKSFLNKSYG